MPGAPGGHCARSGPGRLFARSDARWTLRQVDARSALRQVCQVLFAPGRARSASCQVRQVARWAQGARCARSPKTVVPRCARLPGGPCGVHVSPKIVVFPFGYACVTQNGSGPVMSIWHLKWLGLSGVHVSPGALLMPMRHLKRLGPSAVHVLPELV